MFGKTEVTATFSLIPSLTRRSLFEPIPTFSNHSANTYLHHPEYLAVQSYISRVCSPEIYSRGTIAHIKLDSTTATQFQYKTKDSQDPTTVTITSTKETHFPDWLYPPSTPLTIIDGDNLLKGDVGSASLSPADEHINFAIIAQDPLNLKTPNGYFIWIHPDTTIVPDSFKSIAFSEVYATIPIFDVPTPKLALSVDQPTMTTTTNRPPAEEDDFDLSLLFDDK